MKRVIKIWGYESIIVNNDQYCGKILTVHANGMASSLHYHREKMETFHILDGVLFLELQPQGDIAAEEISKVIQLGAHESITLKQLTPHRFWTTRTACRFIEFSTPDKEEDSIRIIPSGPIPTF